LREGKDLVSKKNKGLYFLNIAWNGMDWIDLAQDSDQWRALTNTVIKYGVA
jgi:hypothetical protein